MNVEKLLQESTHFKLSDHGVSFAEHVCKCGNCGATAFVNWGPWLRFDNLSNQQVKGECIMNYDMIQVKDEYPNEIYYTEDNDSNEECNECIGSN